ncbi:MAG TPA: DUF167 domain-containing protein [Pseudomonadales bacterium]|nr:DUF167 domain-containing protein [Pseudomonadales bacterium]
MNERKFNLHDGKMGAAITVHIVPGSKQNTITGVLEDGTVTIDLTDQKIDEKANHALVDYLAELLQVKPSQIEIVGGISSSDKLITIMDLDKNAVQSRILKHIS